MPKDERENFAGFTGLVSASVISAVFYGIAALGYLVLCSILN